MGFTTLPMLLLYCSEILMTDHWERKTKKKPDREEQLQERKRQSLIHF